MLDILNCFLGVEEIKQAMALKFMISIYYTSISEGLPDTTDDSS
jgi:hypothetical protein